MPDHPTPRPSDRAVAWLCEADDARDVMATSDKSVAAGWIELGYRVTELRRGHPCNYSESVPRTGACKHKQRPGGCQLHNLHCGYPKCDEFPDASAPTTRPEAADYSQCCDTPNYCSSVRRCTAKDAAPTNPPEVDSKLVGEGAVRHPMTTAPRDGTVILLHFGEDGSSPGWWSYPISPVQNADGTWPRIEEGFPWSFVDRNDGKPFVNQAVDTEYGPSHWSDYMQHPSYTHPSQDAEDATGYYLACFKGERPLGSPVLWWAPNNAGYTTDLLQAGVYQDLTPGYHDCDHTVPVPVNFVRGRRIRHEIDPGDSDNLMFWSAAKLRAAIDAARNREG